MTASDLTPLLAWAGASILAVSDGRRGVAAGLALYSVALAVALLPGGGPVPAVAVAGAGICAALLRARDRMPGEAAWGILPPGSTPRVILCAVTGAVAAFLTLSVLTGPGDPSVRAVAVIGGAMAAARLLATGRRDNALASASLLCLAAAGVEAAIAGPGALAGLLAAAGAAAALGLVRVREVAGGA